jgi:hypothetical protein
VTLLDLRVVAATARRDGWCTVTGSLDDIRAAGHRLGWHEVPTRRGHGPVSTLRPTSATDAHPLSLSAIHGLDAQP